jgi:hypothetical protein
MTAPARDEGDEELDVSALMAFGASCRAFERYHAKSDVAMATVPHWYAMCVKDERVKMGEAATAATRAATSGRLRAFLDGGFAHPSARAMAPERMTSAIEEIAACARRMRECVREASEAMRDFVEATSGRRPSAEETHRISDVPVHIMLTAFKWGTDEEYTIEQWLWMCASVLDGLEREVETREKIVAYLQGGETREDELAGCVAVWSARPFIDDRLFSLVSADPGGE